MPSISSLEKELSGYRRYGRKDRAAAVEAELARLGKPKKKPAAKKAPAKPKK